MKNTCNGLNSRIAMHTSEYMISPLSVKNLTNLIAAGKFEVKSLSPNIPAYDLYLGSHLKPVLEEGIGSTNNLHPFEFYQRLSISRLNPKSPNFELEHLVVDVDIPSSLYRVLKLSKPDTENEYLAYNYKNSITDLPSFHPVSERIISNGTFTTVNATQRHMFIPKLNIGIANMHQFINSYDQEPFVKIYQNTSPYWRTAIAAGPPTVLPADQDAFLKTLNEPWDSKKKLPINHQVIMRTASFGHGRQALDMCVREDGYVMDGKWVSEGVDEDLWIPFAIMVSWKQRMYEYSLKEEGSLDSEKKGSV
jgi:hypothetical protein